MKRAWWLAALGVVAATLALAWNGLGNPFLLDDVTKIIENPDIRRLANLPEKLLYPYHAYQVYQRNDPSRPLVYLIYTLVYSVAELNPFAYHLVGALFHAGSALLVLALARLAQRKLWGTDGVAGPLVAALLFVTSPIQMGVSIYSYALSDVLATFFMLLAVWCFTRRDQGDRLGSTVAMLLALAAKQSAIVVPALLALWDFVFRAEGDFRAWRRGWRRYVPQLSLAFAYLVFRVAYFGGVGDLESYSQAYPWLPYAFSQPWVIVRYVAMSLVPHGLAIDHALYPSTLETWKKIVGALLLLGSVASVWRAYRRAEPTPAARLFFFALAWYLINLAPTSSVVPTVDLLVERRAYAANFGLYVLVLWPFAELAGVGARRLATLLSAVMIAAFAAVSHGRNVLYASSEEVWRDVLATYPNSQRALNSLGNLLSARQAFAEAKEVYEKALAVYPHDYVAHGNYGALMERPDNPFRDTNVALAHFKESSRLNPTVAENYYNVGRVLHLQGRFAEAAPYYQKTLELKPNFYPAMNNLGAIALEGGRVEEAKRYFETALRLDPQYAPAIQNLRVLESKLKPARR